MADKFLLLVEGKDDFHVMMQLLEHHRVPETFRVKDKQGIDNLLETLDVELLEGSLECLGIIVDADVATAFRWDSIRSVLVQSGYVAVPVSPIPTGTIVEQKGKPRVGIWIMPDNSAAGMLEDFVGSFISKDDVLWEHAGECVDAAMMLDCRFPVGQRSKALIHTWLSWQREPGTPLGLAIKNHELNPDAPEAVRLVEWLRRLFELKSD